MKKSMILSLAAPVAVLCTMSLSAAAAPQLVAFLDYSGGHLFGDDYPIRQCIGSLPYSSTAEGFKGGVPTCSVTTTGLSTGTTFNCDNGTGSLTHRVKLNDVGSVSNPPLSGPSSQVSWTSWAAAPSSGFHPISARENSSQTCNVTGLAAASLGGFI
jgi:hypothetical protein